MTKDLKFAKPGSSSSSKTNWLHSTDPVSKKKKRESAGHLLLTPIITATWEAQMVRIKVQGHTGQINSSQDPHLQKNQSEMDWRWGSSVESLLCKCEAQIV
jgi:hypothetical protein